MASGRGPHPTTTCSVCRHPSVLELEAADASGISRRELAKRFGLGKDAVNRHFYGDHPRLRADLEDRAVAPEAPPADPQAGDPDPDSPPPPDDAPEVDRLRWVRAQLQRELQTDPRSDTAREIRQLSQRIGELQGDYRPTVADVRSVEGLPELLAAWFRALDPYPEAARAVIEATRAEAPWLLADSEAR